MINARWIAAAACSWLLTMTACTGAKPTMARKVVMDVNGQQMTGEQFARELAYRLRDQDALSAKDPKIISVMKSKIAEEFLVQTLSEAWARDHALVVKAEDLDAQIKMVQKSYPDDLAFQQALSDEGTNFNDWRARLQNTLLQKQVARKVVEGVGAATESEVQAYYQSNRTHYVVQESAQIRQIVLNTEADAKTMEDELKRGKRMADLAKKFSVSPEGEQGGSVGWVEKGESEVFEPAFRMKAGQRSPILKSAFGWHILEVTGRKPAQTKPLSQVKDDIKRILMEKKEQALYLAWMEEQVRKARVFKDQAFIDALKVETKVP